MKKALLTLILLLGATSLVGCSIPSNVSLRPTLSFYDAYGLYQAKGGTLSYADWIKAGRPGADGKDGKDGVSVTSIKKTKTEGIIDTYTITYSNGKTSTFTITNGKDGEKGITGNPGADGKTPIVRIGDNGNWFIDGNDTGIEAKGPKGDNGDNGNDGKKGDKGDKGDVGAQGPKGDKGEKGDTGPQGEKGDKGDTGEKGEKGETGKDGKNGKDGKDGSSFFNGHGSPAPELGKTGDIYLDTDTYTLYSKEESGNWKEIGNIKGEKGDKGETGNTGEAGEKGEAGAEGPKGEKGDTGTQGEKGEKGEAGEKGDKGDTGEKGDKGDTGEKGDKGDTGEAGKDGISITDVKVADNGDLIITYSDGTKKVAGNLAKVRPYNVNFFFGDLLVASQKVPPKGKIKKLDTIKGGTTKNWYQKKDLSAVWDFDSYTVDDDMNLYADFKGNVFRVTFSNDAKVGAPTHNLLPEAYEFGSPFSLPKPFDAKGKYDFKGWLKEEKGSRVEQKSEGIWDIDYDITLYPNWSEKEEPWRKQKAFLYPQNLVTNQSLINALQNTTSKNDKGQISYGGVAYVKVVANPYPSGPKLFNNGMPIVKGRTYYFSVDNIEWLFLSHKINDRGREKTLRITKKVLFPSVFSRESGDSVRAIGGDLIYSNNYQYSDIRAKLNSLNGSSYHCGNYSNSGVPHIIFGNVAGGIEYTPSISIINSANSTMSPTNPYAGNNTSDKLFLLSYKNCQRFFPIEADRIATPTDYALALGANSDPVSGASKWWTRSPYPANGRKVSYVDENGSLHSSAYTSDDSIGVRPCMYF